MNEDKRKKESALACFWVDADFFALRKRWKKIREKEKLEILDNCDHADEKMFAKENIQKVFDFADQCLQKI